MSHMFLHSLWGLAVQNVERVKSALVNALADID